MRQYDEYKDTGIEWLPKLPSHWQLEQLRKYICQVSKKGYPEKQLLSVTREQGVIVRDTESKEENHNFIPEDLSGYKYVEEGQLVINKMKSWQGAYGVSDYEGIVSPAYFVCDLDFSIKRFFSLALRSSIYISFFAQYSKGIRVGQWDLSPVALKSIPFLEPPLAEQERIVSYLESKTLCIDAYVRERERELQLLNELKEAEVSNVIARGLNPDVKMKDSGIPWIGMIPEHWEVRRLSQVSYEHFISNKNIHHQNLLSLSYGRIIRKDINTTEGLLPASFDTYQVVEEENIVLRLTDLQNDQKSLRVGLVKEEGIVTSAYICLGVLNDSIIPSYLYNTLHSYDIKKLFYSMGGGLRQNLNWQGLKKIDIPLPPIEEQYAIVDYIEDKCAKVNSLMAELEAEIEYLKEYKQKLIADCVTGQINVQSEL